MTANSKSYLSEMISKYEQELLADWIQNQLAESKLLSNVLKEVELREQSREFLHVLRDAIQQREARDIDTREWSDVREFLMNLSSIRAQQGFSSAETATFIFSLKQPLFAHIRKELEQQPQRLADETWTASLLLDKLGLYTVEIFQKSREEMIARQQQELLELSTPVVQLWENVLALPLIGTLDSERTQIVMENLLNKIVSTGASIAIIDITGVPTVDTLVAQHLLKTVAAARLMGADCIISGIRPQIAQTLVHLGVELNEVTTKATLAAAFMVALQRMGTTLTRKG